MEKLILTLHIIVCVVLVILVLLQSGKEGMGVIFGGGSSSLFGSTGAGGILVKLTTFVAVIFLATSLGYNIVSSAKTSRHSTVIDIPLDDPSAPPTPPAPDNAASPAHESEAAKTPAENAAPQPSGQSEGAQDKADKAPEADAPKQETPESVDNATPEAPAPQSENK